MTRQALLPGGSHAFGDPARQFLIARHEVTVDVFNPGSVHGYSHKPMLAFAAGGFMLVDRRRDFVRAFGDAGEQVTYDQDLDAKIDRFLTNPHDLVEVREAIRETIFARFQLKDVLLRVLDEAFRCADGIRNQSGTHETHSSAAVELIVGLANA